MSKDHSWNQINEVVTTQAYHQYSLTQTSQERKLSKTLPAVSLELQEVYHTAAHVAWEEKVVSFAIGDCDGIEAREFPKVAFRVPEVEKLLN